MLSLYQRQKNRYELDITRFEVTRYTNNCSHCDWFDDEKYVYKIVVNIEKTLKTDKKYDSPF